MMKIAGFLFVVLIACASAAVPAPIESKNDVDSRQTRLVEGIVVGAIDSVSQNIRDAGLDPFLVEQSDIGYELPVPVIFSAAASIEKFLVTGASNIVIHRINYALLTSRMTFDISLPAIRLTADNARFDMTVLGHNFAGRTSSLITATNPGVKGEVRLNIGIISGITVRSVDLEFYYGKLEYTGFAQALGVDITPMVSQLINYDLPATLDELNNEINLLLEIIVKQVIEDML